MRLFKDSVFIVHLSILAPLLFFICFFNLDNGSNFGTGTGIDESWYIQVTQEIMNTGRWWLPTREHEPFFYKPPLKFWLSSGIIRLLGESIINYRILDAVEGGIIILLTYFVTSLLFSNLNAGFFGAISLIGCWGFLFANGLRFATLDIQLMFFCIPALLLLLDCSINREKSTLWRSLLIGLLIALAVLTKSVAGYLPLLIHFAWLLISGNLLLDITKKKKFYISILTISILIPALWFVPHMILTDGAFERMVGYELVARFNKGFHNKNDLYFYFKAFKAGKFTPVFLTLVSTIFFIGWCYIKNDKKILFFLVWAILPFLIFSILPSRLIWYMHPIFFPCAVLIGGFINFIINQVLSVKYLVLKIIFLILLVLGIFEETVFLTRNLDKVLTKTPRLEIDKLVHEVKSVLPNSKTYIYNAHDFSTRERIFANMIHPKRISKMSSINDSPYIVFTTSYHMQEFSYSNYKELPPVTFNQGPQGILRKEPLIMLVGGIDIKLPSFESRKIVFKLNDGVCSREFDNNRVERSKTGQLTCNFKGSNFLTNMPTRFALSVGRTNNFSNPVNLEIYGNFHEIGTINNIKSNLHTYEFNVPAGVWMSQDNEIYVLLKNDDGTLSKEKFFFNWALIELKDAS